MTMWTGIVLIVFISLLFGYLGKRARYQMGDARITDRLGKQDMIIRRHRRGEAAPVSGAVIFRHQASDNQNSNQRKKAA